MKGDHQERLKISITKLVFEEEDQSIRFDSNRRELSQAPSFPRGISKKPFWLVEKGQIIWLALLG